MRRMKQDRFIIYFLRLYNLIWKSILPFMKKNARLKQGFQNRTSAARFKKADIWIHAASAGEAYLAVHIVKAIDPGLLIRLLVTTSTSQGMDILCRELQQPSNPSEFLIQIEWSPFDMPKIIEKAVKKIDPTLMVLVETELWPAMLYYLKKNRSLIFIINGRLSKNSFKRYRRTRILWKNLSPDRIYATSSLDQNRFQSLFPTAPVEFMFNIKFDDLPVEAETGQKIEHLPNPGVHFLVLASVRKEEEEEMEKILKYILPELSCCVIGLFPRHMHRIPAWEKRLDQLHVKWTLKSCISAPPDPGTIVLWDTFGELKKAYANADAALVGGSFKPLGGQNFIEPAISGVATVTGPYLDNFKWVGREIFEKNIVFRAENWKEAADRILHELKYPVDRNGKRESAVRYVLHHQGGTRQAADEIVRRLSIKRG
jgi:3-deoxy-D-manno-octulosonic-acid transferase